MHFADRPATETEIHVAAPPEKVWSLVTDITVPARCGTELQDARWEGTDGPRLGARFTGRNFHPARGEWETTSTVIDLVPGRCFAWAVGDPDVPSAVWRLELEPDGDGTRLRYRAQMGPGPSGITPLLEQMPDKEEKIIARRLDEWRRNMTTTVTAIKAEVEGTR